MNRYFLALLLIFFSKSVMAQESEYPKFYIQNGDTIGIIYSIDQVQKIYNEQVLLSLFKDVRLGCDTLLKRYFVVVNKYEQKQLVDRLLIEQYEKNIKEKNSENQVQLTKISNLEKDLSGCDEQKKLQTGQINNFNKIVDQLQSERKWLIGGTIGFGVLSVFLLGILAN